MRWYKAGLYALEQVSTDATNKPVCKPRQIGSALFRAAPLHFDIGDVGGNRERGVRRTFLTKAPYSLLKDAVSVSVGGAVYDIENVSDMFVDRAVTVRRGKAQWL